MNIETIVSLIGSLGFPIAMCIYLIFAARQTETEHTKQIEIITAAHKEETENLRQTLAENGDKTRTVIENNTNALTILNERLCK